MVVEFTMNVARDVILSKSLQLGYSDLHYNGSVLDTPCPDRHQAATTSKPEYLCSAVLESEHVAETPIPHS